MSNFKQNEQDIERLLNAAGQRRNPPEEMRARVYASTLEAWQALPEQPIPAARNYQAKPGHAYLAMAATLLVAVAVSLVMLNKPDQMPSAAGEVVFVQGNYALNGNRMALADVAIQPGASLRTSPQSILTLRTQSGALVTVDQNTQINLTEHDTVYLHGGRLYADVEATASDLVVQTAYAKIVDIGTQFEVSVAEQGKELLIAVREGQVDVSGKGEPFSVVAAGGLGEVVHMRESLIQERHSVPTTSPRWDWRRAGRKPYDLASSSVYDYLKWMARDTGHELVFASKAVEQMTRIGILQGKGSQRSSDDTEIMEALAATRFQLDETTPGQWMIKFRR
jgi:ferric-dicitrate binding protein FerR (iron transport regulator)